MKQVEFLLFLRHFTVIITLDSNTFAVTQLQNKMTAKDQYLSNLAIWISSVLAAAERNKNQTEEHLRTVN
jgi:hypothetical protein